MFHLLASFPNIVLLIRFQLQSIQFKILIMKKCTLLLFLMSCAFLQAQIVTIPDTNFKNTLVNVICVDTDGDEVPDSDADTNDDGEIQVSEAEAVLGLFVSSYGIVSLAGIESFVNLEVLHCGSNQLVEMDLSQNPNLRVLVCNSNELNSLSLTQNSNLIELWCASNNLTELDLSQNISLEWLSCGANELTTLDLTQNENLGRVNCAANNLTSLYTANPNLTEIYCWMNQITSLDVSQNPNLVILSCRDNQLIELYVDNGNNVNIETMLAYNNPDLFCIQVDDETVTPPTCDIDNHNGWCIDDWASYSNECILDVNDFDAIAIAFYPNPATDLLNISSQNPISSIKIYALNGALVKDEGDNSQIDVSYLKAGIYMLKITINGSTFYKKFIKS